MAETATTTVRSLDGTRLAVDRGGRGPAVVLVHGAFTDRAHPTLRGVAAGLAPWFTVANYDRRGRGASGDTLPYAVEREIEDLAAVVDALGGTALVFGGSSGAALALEAAARLDGITALALWEPPYHVDPTAPPLPDGFADTLDALVADGRPGDALERFLIDAVEVPPAAVAALRDQPPWAAMEALAHTLAREARVLGPGNRLPAERLAGLDRPTMVLNGDRSPGWMARAAEAVAAAIPGSCHRVLPGQAHDVAPDALVPELLEFFTTTP